MVVGRTLRLCARGGPRVWGLAVLILLASTYKLLSYSEDSLHTDLPEDTSLRLFAQQQGWAPFEPSKPIFAQVIAYQRTGSTFFGDLFNEKPAVFFIYEPLDALYTAMYGTTPGWNVPSDIFTYKEGKNRMMPEQEVGAQQWTLTAIFTCRMSELPTAMLLHPFWQMFRWRMHVAERYIGCLRKSGGKMMSNIRKSLEECQTPIRDVCPSSFDNGHQNITLCRDLLWNEGAWTSKDTFDYRLWADRAGADVADRFSKYFTCLDKYRPVLTQCARLYFDDVCVRKDIRMIKTVRSNMQIPGALLEKNPNYRLLHFFRDPRGTVRSRLHPNATWSLGAGEQGGARQAARGYCSVVHSDFRQRQVLELSHRGKILQVIFDAHTQSPASSSDRIYAFVNATHLASATKWHEKKRALELGNANATLVAEKWKSEMAVEDIKAVNEECGDFFRDIQHNWGYL